MIQITDEGVSTPNESVQQPQVQAIQTPYQENLTSMPRPPMVYAPEPSRRRGLLSIALAIVIAGVMISASILVASAGMLGNSSSSSSSTQGASLSSVTLTSPSDGEVMTNNTITLSWASVDNAVEYRVYISTYSTTSPYNSMKSYTTTGTSYEFSAEDGTYNWRVYAIASDGSYTYSDVGYFTIKTALNAPEISGPDTMEGIVLSDNQTLSWTSVTNATSYRLQIAYDESFSDIMTDVNQTGTTYALDNMQTNTTYYWRVMAVSSEYSSSWSDISSLCLGYQYFLVSYTWKYDSQNFTIAVNITGLDYYTAKSANIADEEADLIDYGAHVNCTDNATVEVATEIKEIAMSMGFDENQTLGLTLAFVQTISYGYDDTTTGYSEYVRYPVETLVDEVGDCDCKSVLFLSLVETSELNYTGVLLEFVGNPGHMAVGVICDNVSGTYFNYNGEKYYYCETTATGWAVGQMPSEVSAKWNRATIIEP